MNNLKEQFLDEMKSIKWVMVGNKRIVNYCEISHTKYKMNIN